MDLTWTTNLPDRRHDPKKHMKAVRLSRETHERLTQLADTYGTSMTGLVGALVDVAYKQTYEETKP